eukprot:1579887-Amphidinium_carterae.1
MEASQRRKRRRQRSTTAEPAVPPPLVAESSVSKGYIVFEEAPLVAAQSNPGSPHQQPPLFCAQCHRPAGPITVMLALASGRISRDDLIAKVRESGDHTKLLEWDVVKMHNLPELPNFGGDAYDMHQRKK